MLLMCYASALSYDLVLLIAWYSLIYFYDYNSLTQLDLNLKMQFKRWELWILESYFDTEGITVIKSSPGEAQRKFNR